MDSTSGQPPVPQKRRRLVWWLIGAVIVFGVLANAVSDGDESEPSVTTTDTAIEVTAEDVVDAISASKLAEFCESYFALGDYDAALKFFKRGYTQSDPPAEEVFDEALTRC